MLYYLIEKFLILFFPRFWDICIIQFNPCVTVALVVARVIPYRLLIPNIIAQLAGATLASYFDWFKNRFLSNQIISHAVRI